MMRGLTQSEREILTLLSQGMRDREVCQELKISEAAFAKAMKRIEARADLQDDTTGTLLLKGLRIQRENSLRSLDARFRALMSIVPEAVLVIDGRTGEIKEANENACELFGHTRQTLIGLGVEDLVPERYRSIHPAYRLGFLSSLRKRELGYHPPIFGVKADGTEIEMAIALTATTADDDVMVVCTTRSSWIGAGSPDQEVQSSAERVTG